MSLLQLRPQVGHSRVLLLLLSGSSSSLRSLATRRKAAEGGGGGDKTVKELADLVGKLRQESSGNSKKVILESHPALLPLLRDISDPAKKTGMTAAALRDIDLDSTLLKWKDRVPPEALEYKTLQSLLEDVVQAKIQGMTAKIAVKSVRGTNLRCYP